MNDQELIQNAIEGSKKSYAPYSNFHVGAAVLCESGNIYQGCNVENASYGLCNCAERTALFSAVVHGEPVGSFTKLAIYVDRPEFTPPCGACRQVIGEIAPKAEIILANNKGQTKRFTAEQLMPFSFGSKDLEA